MIENVKRDLVVGRNVTLGGDLTAQGDVRAKGNLEVDGFLRCRHMASAMKGLFETKDKLEQAYPNPKPGWFALVGDELPARLYVVLEGAWHDSGKTASGLDVDMDYYKDLVDDEEERATAAEKANADAIAAEVNRATAAEKANADAIAAETERAMEEEGKRLVVNHIRLQNASSINQDLNATLNGLTIDETTTQNRGYTQISAMGNIVNVWNYPLSYSMQTSIQEVEGALNIFSDGTLGIGETYRRLTRKHTANGWGAWTSIDIEVKNNSTAISALANTIQGIIGGGGGSEDDGGIIIF